MTKPDNRLDSVQDSVLDEVDIAEAARRLGLTPETIRKRLQRGTLPGHKASDGTWRVTLESIQDKPGQRQDKSRTAAGQAENALVRRLEDEVAFLRTQLEARDDEIRRAHILIQQAQGKTPELPAPADRRAWWRRLFG